MNARTTIPKPVAVTPQTGGGIQAKLRIGEPDDMYEREADKVADRVMRMPEPNVQRKCAACEKEEDELQRKAVGPSVASLSGATASGNPGGNLAPSVVHDVLSGCGRPLDSSVRSYMEPRFGHDFGNVRVHDGTKAAESAGSVNALAYTVGRNLVFAQGAYRPESERGRRLIAHELTHVLQQRGGDRK